MFAYSGNLVMPTAAVFPATATREASAFATVEALMVSLAVGSMPVVAVKVAEVVMSIETFAAIGVTAVVAVPGIKVMIYPSIATGPAVIPGACAEEQAAIEPLGTIVAVRGALVRGIAVVPVGAHRGRPTDIDAEGDLSRGACRCSEGKANRHRC